MAYCPECRRKYPDGSHTCPECNRTLVDHLTPKARPSSPIGRPGGEEWVVAGTFFGRGMAQMGAAFLEEAGIPFVLEESLEYYFGSNVPSRIYVRSEDLARARELLESGAIPLDEEPGQDE